MAIEWSRRASLDIRNLRKYIAKDSPVDARRFTEQLLARVENLARFPAMGRRVREAAGRDDVRELVYRGYRIIYLVQPDRLFLVSIIHHSRNPGTQALGCRR